MNNLVRNILIWLIIGAALMETIRNSLLMAGIDPYWQGTFLGIFIVGAVWLEKVKNKKN